MASSTTGMASVESLLAMPLANGCIAEYVWIDGYNKTRAKARFFTEVPKTISDLPDWNYDGSSTGQAPGANSEVIIKPQAMYPDPFRGHPNILVMCDTYTPEGTPLPSNTRYECAIAMGSVKELVPWFGLEQEYFLMNPKTGKPVGFPANKEPEPQGPYYCGVAGSKMFGRDIADAHFKACIYAGIKISGINSEVAPGQWEYQIGPAIGMEEGDMLWMSRYMLERIAEMRGYDVNYEPKPLAGDWNGSGCHANFSTKPMREDGGYENTIIPAIEKLSKNHAEHLQAYGKGNEMRLTGKHETASMEKFKWGVADRGASVRVGADVAEKGKGYFEDRRPAGNCDPYVVTRLLVQTCCLD